jgi:predicted TIM-barrel fold metal-dependent hydrolase
MRGRESVVEIIDAQLHEVGPRLTWPDPAQIRRAVTTEVTLGWMDAAGVDIAVVNPHDEAWADEAARLFPDRLRLVISFRDPAAPAAAGTVRDAASRPNVVGGRCVLGKTLRDPDGRRAAGLLTSGALEPVFVACEEQGLPLFLFVSGLVPLAEPIARAHPGLTLIIDHLGIQQPPLAARQDLDLAPLLALAGYPNVAVKLCGAPVFSAGEYPYADVWPRLRPLLDTFGAARVMWASDISRFAGRIGWDNAYPQARPWYQGKHSYAESLHMIRDTEALSPAEKELILGGTARRVLRLGSQRP